MLAKFQTLQNVKIVKFHCGEANCRNAQSDDQNKLESKRKKKTN